MNYFISTCIGIVIAVMIAINGLLTRVTGSYGATVLIHITGLVVCGVLVLIIRPKVRVGKGTKWLLLTGGLWGLAATVFNNVAFLYIGMTPITALGLLGQSVTALSIDACEVFGPRPHYTWRTGAGVLLLIAGIVIMLVI